jgi:hypothetical protein
MPTDDGSESGVVVDAYALIGRKRSLSRFPGFLSRFPGCPDAILV